jgi:translation elongation factor EF-Tu-like GTPase
MDHGWQLHADECFVIRGRGLVVVGRIEGEANTGDRAVLTTPDGQSRHVSVLGIDHSHAERQGGGVGNHVGILVNVTDMRYVPRGAVLRSAT